MLNTGDTDPAVLLGDDAGLHPSPLVDMVEGVGQEIGQDVFHEVVVGPDIYRPRLRQDGNDAFLGKADAHFVLSGCRATR